MTQRGKEPCVREQLGLQQHLRDRNSGRNWRAERVRQDRWLDATASDRRMWRWSWGELESQANVISQIICRWEERWEAFPLRLQVVLRKDALQSYESRIRREETKGRETGFCQDWCQPDSVMLRTEGRLCVVACLRDWKSRRGPCFTVAVRKAVAAFRPVRLGEGYFLFTFTSCLPCARCCVKPFCVVYTWLHLHCLILITTLWGQHDNSYFSDSKMKSRKRKVRVSQPAGEKGVCYWKK